MEYECNSFWSLYDTVSSDVSNTVDALPYLAVVAQLYPVAKNMRAGFQLRDRGVRPLICTTAFVPGTSLPSGW